MKASLPISLTVEGRIIWSIFVPKKAFSPIIFTGLLLIWLGILTVFSSQV